MLLGIPGDNTYSNYAEAQRAFWRQTVLPLVQRAARALTLWLAPAYGGELRLVPDLDQVEALSPEREALWARLDAASFLTDDEKRAAAGYGSKEEEIPATNENRYLFKYRPDQTRDDQGRWVDEGLGPADNKPEGQAGEPPGGGDEEPGIVLVAGRGKGGIPKAVLDWSVRQFISQYCKGKVNAEIPSQFEGHSIQDLLDIAKGGDAAARKCLKILKEPRFRK